MKRILLVFASIMVLSGFCNVPVHAADRELIGAGATFPYPLYSKMFEEYHKKNGVQINYQPIGSGGGQRQLLNKTVDFGGSDAYMGDEDLKNASGKILHIPTCVGAVVLTYNLPGNPSLKFTPDIIADLFLGKITNWSDPRIKAVNPSVNLPNSSIITVHRSDGSGTNYIFTHYLSSISQGWKSRVGEGLSVNWPNGLGAKGNPGVSGIIKQTPGSLGYVEFIYAVQNQMPVATLKNEKGKFITPSLESASLSANMNLPSDTRAFITNTSLPNGYPLSGFTWLLVYQEQNYANRSKEKAEALVKLLWWATHEGQTFTTPLQYAPLPGKVVKKAEAIIQAITFDGKPLLSKRR